MTSSLVGSEMCIRDRTTRPLCAVAVAALALPLAAAALLAPGRRCPWAVSYTHLTLPTICSV
eukprot:9852068-Prorocentrum_lima.AAC.1